MGLETEGDRFSVCDMTIQQAVYVNMLQSMPAARAKHVIPLSTELLKISEKLS